MILSKKTKYALKAMLLLAREYQKGPLQISDLAKRERIPKKFLEAILLILKNHGILQSKKGKGGGYFLEKPPAEIRIGSVIRIFEGPLAPVPCVGESAHRKCGECLDGTTCGIRLVMKEVYGAVSNILDSTSIMDAVEREDSLRKSAQNALMYEI